MENEVHIWQASTEAAAAQADVLIATLASDERARGERLINPEHRERFLLAQAILRNVLSRYIEQAPETIRFRRGEHGKPYLQGSELQFNLTHSHQCVLVAVTTKHEVGVDVEYLERTHAFDDLIKRFFSVEEQQEYFEYKSDNERRLAFYRGWTRKEAYLKATGLGLTYPLDQFAVSLAANEKRALLRVADDTEVRTKWTVLSFDIAEEYLASLAIESTIDDLQTYNWSLFKEV